ncbi:MAG: hypothetical protein M3O50_19775 [Myxococcota bacterium]|nr:hypothetical protein [Myxococcota bacterium]
MIRCIGSICLRQNVASTSSGKSASCVSSVITAPGDSKKKDEPLVKWRFVTGLVRARTSPIAPAKLALAVGARKARRFARSAVRPRLASVWQVAATGVSFLDGK